MLIQGIGIQGEGFRGILKVKIKNRNFIFS